MQATASICRSLAVQAAAQPRRTGACPAARTLGRSPLRAAPGPRRSVSAAASSKPADFDTLLMTVADKFEKADNKPVLVGYLAATFFAIFTAEWFIHLPLFNVLLGFPIQFLGLVVAPYLALRWFVNNDGDWWEDFEGLVSYFVKQLPGLGK